MTKDTFKRKTDLLRNARSQLRDWSALFDSLRAIGDPHAAKVVAEQLSCQHGHLTETVNLLGEMTQKVCTATLTLDLDPNQIPLVESTNGAQSVSQHLLTTAWLHRYREHINTEGEPSWQHPTTSIGDIRSTCSFCATTLEDRRFGAVRCVTGKR